MTTVRALRRARLRSHLLLRPAPSPLGAARRMLAVQAQEFWAGRWALAVRSAGRPGLSDVDAAFDRGELVRSWTMRGTIHVVPAEDLAWVLSATAERQLAQAAGRHRQLGLDEDAFRRAERAARGALRGGGRLTRAELFDAFAAAGVDPAGQRAVHLLQVLSLRGVVCHGPVVPREGGPTREQHVVLVEDHVPGGAAPEDPAAELFVRYVAGHGPATAEDFAWWSGLTLGVARASAAVAAADARVVADPGGAGYVALAEDRARRTAPRVVALPAFDEFYISYADRTPVCRPELLARVGPGANGMVRPVLLADGEVAGVWSHSRAAGRGPSTPEPEVLAPEALSADDARVALERYAAFIGG